MFLELAYTFVGCPCKLVLTLSLTTKQVLLWTLTVCQIQQAKILLFKSTNEVAAVPTRPHFMHSLDVGLAFGDCCAQAIRTESSNQLMVGRQRTAVLVHIIQMRMKVHSIIDDVLVSNNMKSMLVPKTSVLPAIDKFGHLPILSQIPLHAINFIPPGPEIPLPDREASLMVPLTHV